ncbi:sialate:O-sulfotransferase 1-like [Dysidea avara]|uniref:sialate:O-sulfotransferase 1-like n=1 Tax=Dysidea avara TaxID=196820 RepID=UPI00332D6533
MSSPLIRKHAVFLLLMVLIIIGCFGVYFKGRTASISSTPDFLESRETASRGASTKTTDNRRPITYDRTKATRKPKKGLTVQQSTQPRTKSFKSSFMETAAIKRFGTDLTDEALAQFKKCAGRVLSQRSSGYIEIPPPKQHCKTMSFRKSGLTVLLVSYPGSGNSWVRQLLETTTGIYSGSFPCDSTYVQAGMIGEGVRTGNVIVIKAHKMSKSVDYDKVIYLIRNPFATLVADWSRFESKQLDMNARHVNEVGQEHFGNNSKWDDAVREDSTAWEKHVATWLGHIQRPTLVVQYEELQRNLDGELKRMLGFLERPYTEDDIQCTVHSTVDGFHRKHTKQLNPFTASQTQFILNKLHLVDNILKENNISYHNVYT